MSRSLVPAAALLLAFSLPVPAAARDGDGGADAPVFRLIDELRERAADLKVDGRIRDWSGFPMFEDERSAVRVDPSLDIVAVALAPRDTDLLVMIRTKGRPSEAAGAFEVRVDFLGLGAADLGLIFGKGGARPASVFPERGRPASRDLGGLDVAVGEVVEIRIPLLVAASWFPEAVARPWREGRRRPHVRVQTFSRTPDGKGRADDGPAAASFRLVRTPCPLDPPGPREGAARRAVGMPVEGRWYVRQGPFGLWSHGEQWAYDLSIVDRELQVSRVVDSRDPGTYYGFGRPVRAPEAGRVIFAEGSREDHVPLEDPPGKDNGNNAMLRFEDGLRLFLAHLRGGTVTWTKGDRFEAGGKVGEVGNSGATRAPHLHVALHDRPGEFEGLPMAFKDVRVGLNPGPDDPWNRDLPSWEIREGFFVEPIP